MSERGESGWDEVRAGFTAAGREPPADLAARWARFREEQPAGDAAAFLADVLTEAAPVAASPAASSDTLDWIRTGSAEAPPDVTATAWAPTPGGPPPPRQPDLDPERYQLLGEVGSGGMADVFLVRDRRLNRTVAFKQLRDAGGATPAQVSQFVTEAQVTAQLEHPAVVPVYALEVGPEGQPAYAMKLVRGEPLDAILSAEGQRALNGEAPLHPMEERLEWLLKLCDAVAFAHKRGVIHRDLKPSNVMVGRFGELYLVDWGLARLLDGDRPVGVSGLVEAERIRADPAAEAEHTRDGVLRGTPAYMSPEQARGDNQLIGPATDQFALGLILYELVLLQRAYPGRQVWEVLDRARRGLKDPPSWDAPAELLAIIDKATAFDPAARYPSVASLAEDLRRALRGEETLALPDDWLRRLARRLARRQRAVLSTLAVLVVLTPLAIGLSELRGRLRLVAQRARAEAHARVLTDLVARGAEHAQRLDRDMLAYEGLVSELAGAATQALAGPAPAPAGPRPYWRRDFLAPDRAPPDLAQGTHYPMPVSADWPVTGYPASTPPSRGDPDLRLLLSLRPAFRASWTWAPGVADPSRSPAELTRRILEHRSPLEWVYVTLDRTGAMALFPGSAGPDFTRDYDPRRRPWYQQGKEAHRQGVRCVWTPPYLDAFGLGMVITCVRPIGDEGGLFQGVAALDLSLAHMREQILAVGLPGLRQAALLDGEGRVILRAPLQPGDEEADGEPRLDPRPAVQALVRDPGGLVELPPGPDGRARVAVGSRLASLGWTLVLELELASSPE